ncbi:terminase [Streptomyces sp. NPDC096013]|uniref:terminase n=1 Tax=Streptomyces sp. NPDC096013 TaxID=3366069 RepID=UPI0037FE3F6E
MPWRRRVDTGRWDGVEDQEALDFTSPAGLECVELAEDAGVDLDPWQRLALHHSLVEDDEGRWAALDVVLNVARQNGKGGFLEVRQLAEVILFGGRLVIHTAHQFNTAAESFLRLDQMIEGSYALSRRVKNVRRSHGEEGFTFFSGARIRFLARGGDSGRGFSGDLVLMDEAMKLRAAPIGALMPVLSARPNPQLVFTGSAGLGDESEQLALLRARALAEGEPDQSLCYLEHSIAPHAKECPTDAEGRIVCESHDNRGDEASFARANPALGIRIRTAYVLQEMRSMRPDLFDRERLGVGDYPEVTDETWQVIPKDKWEAGENVRSRPGDPVAFAIDTNPERTWTAISVVGASGDGVHAEVVAHQPGTDWVVDWVTERDKKWNPCAWVIDEGGPAGSLVPAVRKALMFEDDPERLDRSEYLHCPKVREVTQACGMFHDRVMDTGTLYHLGQAPLTAALAGAKKREVGDAWAWARKSDGVDISPLVSATNAVWGWEMFHDAEEEGAPNVW